MIYLIIFSIIIASLILGFLIFLFMCAPHTKRSSMFVPFEEILISHRGLYDNERGLPENTIPAFENSINHGFGIELDVQLTKDNQLVVFHDERLDRLMGVDKSLEECTYDELLGYSFKNSDIKVPLFKDVLEIINGRVPLVVEIKYHGNWKGATIAATELLKDYKGTYCVQSFNPLALRWLKKNKPHILRGQLASDFFKDTIKLNFVLKILLSNFLANFLARPDFLSYNAHYTEQRTLKFLRKFYKVKCMGWTPATQEQLEICQQYFKSIIFDGFIPNSNEPIV